MLRCPKLEGQDSNKREYIYSDGALRETSDSCRIVKQNAWLWKTKTALKNNNSLESWWFLQAGRNALRQLIGVWEWGGCPSPRPLACVGHGAGGGARSGTVWQAGALPRSLQLVRNCWFTMTCSWGLCITPCWPSTKTQEALLSASSCHHTSVAKSHGLCLSLTQMNHPFSQWKPFPSSAWISKLKKVLPRGWMDEVT